MIARERGWLEAPPVDPGASRAAHLPEYRRRLLAVYAACAGWSRPAVAPLWPWVDFASECFERGDRDGWHAALAELERYTGVTAAAAAE